MQQNLTESRGGNLSFGNASLAASTVANFINRINVANQVHYVNDGKFLRVVAVNNQSFSTGHTDLVNNKVCVFALWADGSAALSTTQGEIVSSEEVEQGKRVVPLPDVVASKTLIGLVKVKAGVGATFTPSSTNFNATNINAVFYNIATMPSKPFTSTVNAA